MTPKRAAALLIAAASLALMAAEPIPDPEPQTHLDASLRCRLGAYALADGRFLAIGGDAGDPRNLEYTLSTGEFGALIEQKDGGYVAGRDHPYAQVRFEACAQGRLSLTETGHAPLTGHRIALPQGDTTFASGTERLHGKLVMPLGGHADAIVVWITGSNDEPETDDVFWQYELPRHGVGVFVYDKRGTGGSTGELSADFDVRADDTAAAVREARRLAPGTHRFGVLGGSQGGWIAPLTATKTKLDFVIAAYAMAQGVTAQDRYEVEDQLRAAGYGDEVIAKSREITAATEHIVRSHWQEGWEQLDALKAKYAGEPWLKAIGTQEYTGILLQVPSAGGREMGPKLDKHISFNYDPRPVIETITPRQLWLLGGSDHTTPSPPTIAILREIQKTRRDLDLVVFKAADHGLVERFETAGAKRRRYAPGLLEIVPQWILHGALPAADADKTVMAGR
jgi:pimeloyl-ACP methyl ester carboxylesterase